MCVCECALAYNSGLLYPEEKDGYGGRGRNKEVVLHTAAEREVFHTKAQALQSQS